MTKYVWNVFSLQILPTRSRLIVNAYDILCSTKILSGMDLWIGSLQIEHNLFKYIQNSTMSFIDKLLFIW